MNKPTPKQLFTLFQFTKIQGPKWSEKGISKEQATEIIGVCFKLAEKKHDAKLESELSALVHKFFPEWEIDKFYKYIGKKGKKAEGKEAAPEVEAPEVEEPEQPEVEESEAEDDEVEKAKKALEKAIADREKKKAEEEERKRREEEEKNRKESIPVIPQVPPTPGYIKPSCFDEIVRLASTGMNIFLSGPRGLGKSRLAKEVAHVLGKEFFCMSFSGGITATKIFGKTVLKVDSEGKQFSTYELSDLLKAVQTNCIVCLDEYPACDSDLSQGLNSLLEPDSREIQTEAGLIKAHEGCVFIATGNTDGRQLSPNYSANQRADDSMLGRFIPYPMDYDLDIEKQLLKAMKIPATVASKLHEVWSNTRSAVASNSIMYDICTRKLIMAAKLTVTGFTVERAIELCLYNGFSKTEKRKLGL